MLLKDNDNDVYLEGLRQARDNSYVNDATLAFTAYDSDGNAISGATSVSMTYQASSNGNYIGVIPSSVSLTEGAQVRIKITSSNYGISREFWDVVSVGRG